MGVDSRAFLPKTNKDEIKNFINSIAKKVSLRDSGVDDGYKILNFEYKEEKREMNIHTKFLKKRDYIGYVIDRYNIDKEEAEDWWENEEKLIAKNTNLPTGVNGNLVSVGYWGRNIEIMKLLCYKFGGYLDESDSDSEEYYKVDKNYRKIIQAIFGE